MSYILEALKKDEAATDPAAAAALALARSRPKRPWALWVVGAALVLNAAVLGYLFYPRGSDPATALGRSGQPLTQPEATREVAVRPRQRVAPPGQVPQRNRATAPAGSSLSSRPPLPAREVPTVVAAPAVAPRREPASPAPSEPAPAPSTQTTGRVLSPEEAAALDLLPPDTAAAEPPAVQAGETVIGPSQPPASRSRPAGTDRGKRVIQLAELPPSDRQDFPKLEFSTHIFADDPALRAVVVNSRRLSEGESIGEMVLRAVTEDGILVDYRGYRVAVSVIEDWN